MRKAKFKCCFVWLRGLRGRLRTALLHRATLSERRQIVIIRVLRTLPERQLCCPVQ